jgi:hypothetical protein
MLIVTLRINMHILIRCIDLIAVFLEGGEFGESGGEEVLADAARFDGED